MTRTDYTQDNTALTYIANPRVKETRVGDSTNVKKTAVEYHLVGGSTTVALYGLVKKVEVFDTGLSNVIKRVETDYNLGSSYTDRNIIGLPSETRAWGKNDLTNNLEQVSRVTYGYDEGTFSQEPNQIITNPTQHDTANYGSAVTRRGNPTSTTVSFWSLGSLGSDEFGKCGNFAGQIRHRRFACRADRKVAIHRNTLPKHPTKRCEFTSYWLFDSL